MLLGYTRLVQRGKHFDIELATADESEGILTRFNLALAVLPVGKQIVGHTVPKGGAPRRGPLGSHAQVVRQKIEQGPKRACHFAKKHSAIGALRHVPLDARDLLNGENAGDVL